MSHRWCDEGYGQGMGQVGGTSITACVMEVVCMDITQQLLDNVLQAHWVVVEYGVDDV